MRGTAIKPGVLTKLKGLKKEDEALNGENAKAIRPLGKQWFQQLWEVRVGGPRGDIRDSCGNLVSPCDFVIEETAGAGDNEHSSERNESQIDEPSLTLTFKRVG